MILLLIVVAFRIFASPRGVSVDFLTNIQVINFFVYLCKPQVVHLKAALQKERLFISPIQMAAFVEPSDTTHSISLSRI